MKLLSALFCLLAPSLLLAQTPAAPAPANQSLRDRYWLMKTSSQTFKEYKVIKETVLDAEWKIIEDSVNGIRKQLRATNANVGQLKGELTGVQEALKQKEAATAKIEFEANHIGFLGIDFGKGFFILMAVTVVGALVAIVMLLLGRLKLLLKTMKEKTETVDRVTYEFEDYKHKALDKQTKLSRELQNERNKLQELKRV